MTQLDFFDMQEEQEIKWEEQSREEEPKQIESKNKESNAMVLAKRDAGAQWQGQSTADWQTNFERQIGFATQSPTQ